MDHPRWENVVILTAAVVATLLGIGVVAYSPRQPWGASTRFARGRSTFAAGLPREVTDPLPGLKSVIEAAPGLYCGSEPQSYEGFDSLQKLGIRTIISVDGARPRVEPARERGLRYVHIPLGYDGVPPDAISKLSAAMRTTEGPWYIHCHHGRHRGPAAAAIACRAAGLLDAAKALRLLELAKTGAEYPGLWRDVQSFVAVPADAPLPELTELAEVRPLVEAMVSIAERFERVRLAATTAAGEQDRHSEAVLLQEELQEALRLLDATYGDDFRQQMATAADRARLLAAALAQSRNQDALKLIDEVEQACVNCHVQFRNGRP